MCKKRVARQLIFRIFMSHELWVGGIFFFANPPPPNLIPKYVPGLHYTPPLSAKIVP